MIRVPNTGRHEGDISLVNDMEFCGLVIGSVTVPPGKKLRFYGKIAGDLIVQKDAQAAIYGSIAGVVRNHGAAVNILGRAGSVQNTGSLATFINDRAALGAVVAETGDAEAALELPENPLAGATPPQPAGSSATPLQPGPVLSHTRRPAILAGKKAGRGKGGKRS